MLELIVKLRERHPRHGSLNLKDGENIKEVRNSLADSGLGVAGQVIEFRQAASDPFQALDCR